MNPQQKKAAFMNRKALLIVVKAAVFLGTAALLVRMVDWGEFWRSLRQLPPWSFALAVLLNLVSSVVMALRWQLLILAAGHGIAFGPVVAYTMLGMFFNQVLPGSVGGDAVRIWCLGGRHTGWKSSTGIVLWDRVVGMVVLVFSVLVFLPFYYDRVMDWRAALMIWSALFAVFACFWLLQSAAFLGAVERLINGLWRRFKGEEGLEGLGALFAGLRAFLADHLLMAKVFLLSIIVRLLWLIGAWVFSTVMGLRVPVTYYLFAIPLIELIRLVPISVQGLGVRELAFVFFLAPFGVSAAQATLLSMLFFTALTVAGLAAGLIYTVRKWWGGEA